MIPPLFLELEHLLAASTSALLNLNIFILIIQHLKSYLISFSSVIAQLDWAIQKKTGLSGQETVSQLSF